MPNTTQKQMREQHVPQKNPSMETSSLERSVVSSLHAAPVVLFLLQTQCEFMNKEGTEL